METWVHTQHWKKYLLRIRRALLQICKWWIVKKKTFTFGFCCQLWLGVCVKPESQRWVRQTHQDHLSPERRSARRSSSWEDNFLSGLYWRNYSLMEFAVEDWRYSNCSLRDSFFSHTPMIFFWEKPRQSVTNKLDYRRNSPSIADLENSKFLTVCGL